jgi:hypothetical protein
MIACPRTSLFAALAALACCSAHSALLTGEIVDAGSGALLPARVYIQSSNGDWFFPKSTAKKGSALPFRRQAGPKSLEMHTTLSAHPFSAELPAGRYVIWAERGKEYFPAEEVVTVGDAPLTVKLKLKRWIDMAKLGWYSGDTHSHQPLANMTNLVMAEDVNVGFPMTEWVTASDTSPAKANKAQGPIPRAEVLKLDATHIIYPLNTEYEIFTTAGKSHTLGAILILGHKTPFDIGVPPVGSVVAQARREGALLDLEKHSWPWSIAMVPIMKVDLFELSNNHVWQTEFAFHSWTTNAAGKYMKLDMDETGFTEWGWLDFGFKTYYALLNCGFRLRPCAGTAAGVHPVPFGFGRVYVNLPNGFNYEDWMKGLSEGRSFVTTGPMMFVEINGAAPGSDLNLAANAKEIQLNATIEGIRPLERIEIVVNGKVVRTVNPANEKNEHGTFVTKIHSAEPVDTSGWIAVRAFEQNGGRRNLFAHNSPVFFEIPGKPLRPRREETDYLIGRVKEEIARNEKILSDPAMQEYREALRIYEEIGRRAQP